MTGSLKVDGHGDEDDGPGDDHNVDNDHPACVQHVNGVKERMTRRKFRDFLHDQIGISSQVIADRIFVYFNKVFSKKSNNSSTFPCSGGKA